MYFGSLRRNRLAIWGFGCLLLSPAMAADLRIEVLRGDGAFNNFAEHNVVSPVVRVLDQAGDPVVGALVVFMAADEGPRVEFSGYGASATVVTGPSGSAAAPGIRPAGGNGPVEIRVTAVRKAEFASAVIRQFNLGIGSEKDREGELQIVFLPTATIPDGEMMSPIRVQLRIEDGRGRPVSKSRVTLHLLRIMGGQPQEIASATVLSSETGDATLEMPRQVVRTRLEYQAVAESDGRKATRFFPFP